MVKFLTKGYKPPKSLVKKYGKEAYMYDPRGVTPTGKPIGKTQAMLNRLTDKMMDLGFTADTGMWARKYKGQERVYLSDEGMPAVRLKGGLKEARNMVRTLTRNPEKYGLERPRKRRKR